MIVVVTLIVGTLAARRVGLLGPQSWDYLDSWPKAVAVGLAAMFVLTGVAHFVNPLRRDMIAIVPPRLPAPAALVTITGVLELLGAVGLMYPPTRAAAACGLALLMVLMFPANVYAARMPDAPTSMATRLGPRTVEQVGFLGGAVVAGLGGIQ